MKRTIQLTLATVVSVAFMWTLFSVMPNLGPVVKDPAHTYFSSGGDGWKNIYTVAYHTIHDKGLIETQAFNYPDGEHVAFADGQPLLTWGLKLLPIHEPDTVVAVVQLLPFVACILGAILLTWLFLRLRMPLVLSILFGIGIALLSPQMLRLTGHFGLSYGFVIPIFLHLLLSWTKDRSWQWVGTISLAVILLGQFHLYYLAIGLLLCTLYMLFVNLLRLHGSGLRILFQVMVFVFVSFTCSKFLIDFSWPITDRPAAPYGLRAYVSAWEDMLIDRDLAWWKWISANVAKIRKIGNFEGRGYLGIFGGLFLVYVVVRSVILRPLLQVFKKPVTALFKDVQDSTDRLFLQSMLLAGMLSGLIALGYLLFIPGTEYILDRIGPLRQFRSLGRFVWVFYTAVEVSFAVWFVHKTKSIRENIVAQNSALRSRVLLPFLALLPYVLGGVLIAEGARALNTIETFPSKLPASVQALDLSGVDREAFQAVFPIPYFHVGSENYAAAQWTGRILPSTYISLKTGIPNMGVMMSRQSISLARDRLDFNTPWKRIPPVLEQVEESGALLLVVDRKQLVAHLEQDGVPAYAAWFAETDTVYRSEAFLLLSFQPSKENLDQVARNYCAYWLKNAVDTNSLSGNIYAAALDDNGWGLTDLPSGKTIQGSTSQLLHSWTMPPRRGRDAQDLQVSWSAFVGIDGHANHKYELRAVDGSSGDVELIGEASPIHKVEAYDGSWARLSFDLPAKHAKKRLELWGTPTRHPIAQALHVKNLIVSPKGMSIKWDSPSGTFVNGILLETCQ